jgi:hypothetical protein
MLIPAVESNRPWIGWKNKLAIIFGDDCSMQYIAGILTKLVGDGVFLFGIRKRMIRYQQRDDLFPKHGDHFFRLFAASEQATTKRTVSFREN